MTVDRELDELEEQARALKATPCGDCGHDYQFHRGLHGRYGQPECRPVVQVSVRPWKQKALRCKCVRFVEPQPKLALSGGMLPERIAPRDVCAPGELGHHLVDRQQHGSE